MFKAVAFILAATFSTSALAGECRSNESLQKQGFVMHASSEFSAKWTWAQAVMATEGGDWVFDTKGTVRSAPGLIVKVQSFDRLSTPQDTMYSDLVLFTDALAGTPVEVRWFDGKDKHVVYNTGVATCATPSIPFGVNVLF